MLYIHIMEYCGAITEKGMATHSSTLAWKAPWTEEPGRLQSMGLLRVGTTERLHFRFSLSYIGEGNGNPLQCSCLENPRDGGAWWAAIYGVSQSRTGLKRLAAAAAAPTQDTHSCAPLYPQDMWSAAFPPSVYRDHLPTQTIS